MDYLHTKSRSDGIGSKWDPPFLRLIRRFKIGDECWNWEGTLFRTGYGRTYWQGREQRAHRVVYELLRGEIPEGLELDHLCRNRRCVNPDHLEPVTTRINLLRGLTITARNASRIHCPQGHIYDELNTRFYRGSRLCKTCDRDRHRGYRIARKAGAQNYTIS